MSGANRFNPLEDKARLSGLRFQLPGKGWQPFITEDGKVNPDAPITSGYGMRQHPIHGDQRMHHGIDAAFPTGTRLGWKGTGQVQSIKDGTAGYGGYGNLTKFQPEGSGHSLKFAHLSELPKPGEIENGVTILGRVGSTGASTGPHLHLEGFNQGLDPKATASTSGKPQTPAVTPQPQNPYPQGLTINIDLADLIKKEKDKKEEEEEERYDPVGTLINQLLAQSMRNSLGMGSNPYG